MNTIRDSWNNIYGDGASYLEYPNEALVVSYHRIKHLLPKKCICLDYGFGSGNNSEFLIKTVHDLYGIEVSENAKSVTSTRLSTYANFSSENLHISHNDYISEFDNKFDLIIAWHVLSYNNEKSIKLAIKNIYRYLKKGGIFITTLATQRDISRKYSENISDNHYVIGDEIKSQAGCDVIIPKDTNDFCNYFLDFKKIDVGHEERSSYINDDIHSHYYGVFQKI